MVQPLVRAGVLCFGVKCSDLQLQVVIFQKVFSRAGSRGGAATWFARILVMIPPERRLCPTGSLHFTVHSSVKEGS